MLLDHLFTRRKLLLTTGAAGLLALLPRLPAWAQAGDPTGFVNRSAQQLIDALDHAPSEEVKRQELQRIVNQTVDVDGIARFCLGRYWRVATPAQQQEYSQIFHQTLMTSITARIGEYKGVRLVTGRATPTDEGTLVASTITRPGQAPVQVGWLVGTVGGQMKVIDVVAEGTSLRLTQRSDYTSFLSQHANNVQALIDGLKRQAAQ